ncbi:MAG: GNAT family N-acetyltransferase [Congregibacter sp.]
MNESPQPQSSAEPSVATSADAGADPFVEPFRDSFRKADEHCLNATATLLTNDYEARLAETKAEIRAAQQLRHQSLFLEQGAHPSSEQALAAADIDEWDERANHVIVVCRAAPHTIVGTLRLTPAQSLYPLQRFYTEHAFDISLLRQSYSRLLELSRFCIAPDHRQGGILRLIWKYTSQLIIENQIDLLLGCASFPGIDPQQHRASLAYLHSAHLAPSALSPTPIVDNHCALEDFCRPVSGNSIENSIENSVEIRPNYHPSDRSPLRGLPTLLRGYIKLGAKVSRTAIIDPVFNTTFVCVYADTNALLAGGAPLFRPREHSAERS